MTPGIAIILGLLFAFIFACFWLQNQPSRLATIIAKSIMVLTATAIAAIFGIALFVPEQTADNVTVKSEFTEIYAFSDDTTTNDNSFIVAADNEYYYYYKTASGIKQGKIPTDKTTVTFTNETPTLHTATTTTVRHTHWWWVFERDNTYIDKKYTLFVPEGAISINVVPPNSI